jgi:Major tropism determinant N-terminal domain
MATRMQQRRGTAAQWISTNSGNGPVLNPGEIGFETDTGKFKIGDGVSTWLSLSYFADVDTLGSALDGDFVELADIGAASGVAGLDSNKNLIVPGASVIIEGATPDSYEMTITATDPTQDRTITLPDATGTVALTTDIPSLTGYVTETGNQTLTNKSINLANNTVSGTVAEFNIALSDANFVTTTDSGTVTSTMIANETIVDGDIANNAAIAQSKISGLTTDLSNKQDKVSGVSDTEIGYLDGVTSNVQAQLNNKLESSTASSTYAPLASPTFTGTVTLPANTVTSSMIVDETITNTDIANNAAIAQSKVENLTTDLAAKANLSGAAFTGNVSTTADFTVDGNFTVNGSNVLVSATQIQIEDSLIQLGHQNPANTVDLGFVAGYNDGSDKHSGLVKDATDSKWKLFKGVTDEPATTVNFAQATLDDLSVGALEASSLTVGSVSNTEISYLSGLTSNVQAQLDSKLSSATAASTYQTLVSGVSNTEIGYLDGVSSNVQAQIDAKISSSSTDTLTNKTLSLANNTVSGTVAQFNTALSGADFITTTDSGTVTNTMLAGSIANNKLANLQYHQMLQHKQIIITL